MSTSEVAEKRLEPSPKEAETSTTRSGWLDTRSVALCRALMAIWILWDLYRRFALDGFAWFISEPSDSVVPIIDPSMTRHKALVHRVWFYRGSVEFQAVILAVHVLLAAAWGIGWRAELTGPLLWGAETALHGRNDYICDGSDELIRHLLFWMIFLPVSRSGNPKASISWLAKGIRLTSPTEMVGAAPLGYLLQLAVPYWVSLISGQWLQSVHWRYPALDAGHYLVLSGVRSSERGKWLALEHPGALKAITAAILISQLLGPLLILCSSTRHTKCRLSGIALVLLGVWTPVWFLLQVDRTATIGMISTLGALPAAVWGSHKTNDSSSSVAVTKKSEETKSTSSAPLVPLWLPRFFLFYMLTLVLGSSPIPYATWLKWDNGNLGELLRVHQQGWKHFVFPKNAVYGPYPSKYGLWWSMEGVELTEGTVKDFLQPEHQDVTAKLQRGEEVYADAGPRLDSFVFDISAAVDLLRAKRDGNFTANWADEVARYRAGLDGEGQLPSNRYPNSFWETFLMTDPLKIGETKRLIRQIHRHLCLWWNQTSPKPFSADWGDEFNEEAEKQGSQEKQHGDDVAKEAASDSTASAPLRRFLVSRLHTYEIYPPDWKERERLKDEKEWKRRRLLMRTKGGFQEGEYPWHTEVKAAVEIYSDCAQTF